jgi:hypothetical protein
MTTPTQPQCRYNWIHGPRCPNQANPNPFQLCAKHTREKQESNKRFQAYLKYQKKHYPFGSLST